MAIEFKKIGSAPHHDLLLGDQEDVLIVVPEPGFKDTAEAARQTVAALQACARQLGRRCGLVIVANNLLAQEPESRRVYANGLTPELFFGVTLVVSSPLARAIGGVAMRLTKMPIPFTLSDSIEAGVTWAITQRTPEGPP